MNSDLNLAFESERCMQRSSTEEHADRLVTDWSSMTDGELITTAYNSSQKARAILRERLLPAIREVRRRFAAGQQVGEFKGIEDFYRHIGVNPSTVRSWERRARLLADGTAPVKSNGDDIIFILPTTEEHGFVLNGSSWSGRDDIRAIYILPSTYPNFYHYAVTLFTDEDDQDENPWVGSFLTWSIKPVRADAILMFLEFEGLSSRLLLSLKWTGWAADPVANNPFSLDAPSKKAALAEVTL
jgi:hypothetical protein